MTAGPVSRIRRAALQTDKFFEISSREVSMMSTLSVLAGFASPTNLEIPNSFARYLSIDLWSKRVSMTDHESLRAGRLSPEDCLHIVRQTIVATGSMEMSHGEHMFQNVLR